MAQLSKPESQTGVKTDALQWLQAREYPNNKYADSWLAFATI